MRQAAVLALLVGVGLAFAVGAPAERTALTVQCNLAGIHYLGTTKQGQKVCLTLTPDGKSLRQYQFGGRFKCSDGSTQSGLVQVEAGSYLVKVDGLVSLGASASSSKVITRLALNGSFTTYEGSAPSVFKGKVLKLLATGSLRQHFEYGTATTSMLTCDTGTTTWTARRAPH